MFLAALGKRWWALLSSAMFTMIGLYALVRGKSNHWVVTVSIAVAVISFVIASFAAWKEQYDPRIAAEILNDDSTKKKEIGRKLAALMREETEIRVRLARAPDPSEFLKAVAESDEWISRTVALLNEAGFPTDAEAFSQVRNLSPVQEQVDEFRHVDAWKRDAPIRLAMHRKQLDQIMSNRRL